MGTVAPTRRQVCWSAAESEPSSSAPLLGAQSRRISTPRSYGIWSNVPPWRWTGPTGWTHEQDGTSLGREKP